MKVEGVQGLGFSELCFSHEAIVRKRKLVCLLMEAMHHNAPTGGRYGCSEFVTIGDLPEAARDIVHHLLLL